jgi:hypothetical protein
MPAEDGRAGFRAAPPRPTSRGAALKLGYALAELAVPSVIQTRRKPAADVRADCSSCCASEQDRTQRLSCAPSRKMGMALQNQNRICRRHIGMSAAVNTSPRRPCSPSCT